MSSPIFCPPSTSSVHQAGAPSVHQAVNGNSGPAGGTKTTSASGAGAVGTDAPYLAGERIEELIDRYPTDHFGFARAVEDAVRELHKEHQCK